MDISADLLSTRANLVIQVDRSHLERSEDFLRTHYCNAKPSNGDGHATQLKSTAETPVVEILAT
eukprot:CAMPEP_0172326816 /NCGR_PEP_ID=MMETSP1058-20130122/57672_1 /TAXON_ID=83371 /ORGANISM="Detonula confervacea, Strain CCMP 353" /LENGTH=63 /DNA_ID=CAMNT_0013043697 /DNA_START=8 /DNA_END=195 /DNA_ORIENTATION=-